MFDNTPVLGRLDDRLRSEPFGLVFTLGSLYLGAAVGIGITQADMIPAFEPVTYLVLYSITGSLLISSATLPYLWRTVIR